MITVTVSPKYQIVIPKVVREALAIEPGQKVQVIHYLNRIELVPIRQMKSARGFLKGIETSIEREDDRL
jgi:AbrB family looped-hinge helix DNA binding protein